MEVFLVGLMVVFATAVFMGILFRYFGLPSLIGQVLAGFIIGVSGLIGTHDIESMRLFGSLGVTLLLFLVGLEMNFKEIRHTGRTVIKIFLIQTVLLCSIYLAFSVFALKLNLTSSILFALALTFSSTIVVVKMLSENKDLSSFSGKLSLGLLLMQDLLAIFVLVLLPGFSDGFNLTNFGGLVFKILILFLSINVAGHYLITLVEKFLVKTTEDLVLLSLVWFSLSVYFSVNVLHLTPEIGGILAGISLSTSWGHFQIVSKVKTLRDIFLTVFFVLLGLEIGVGKVDWLLVLELTGLAIFIKFIVTELSSYWSGLSGKVAFSLSINVTQLSEFSIIVLSFGLVSGFWESSLVTAVTVAGLISMVLSTILIGQSSKIYKIMAKKFPRFFRSSGIKAPLVDRLRNHVVLLGGDRTGRSILASLKKNGETVLVVDFNPAVVDKLKSRGENAVFADASDPDVLDISNMSEAKMIISTVKDFNDSLALLAEIKQAGITAPTVVDAETASQASELYEVGASYVIFPHFVSGLHLGQLLKKFEKDTGIIQKYRSKQNEVLKEIYEGEF